MDSHIGHCKLRRAHRRPWLKRYPRRQRQGITYYITITTRNHIGCCYASAGSTKSYGSYIQHLIRRWCINKHQFACIIVYNNVTACSNGQCRAIKICHNSLIALRCYQKIILRCCSICNIGTSTDQRSSTNLPTVGIHY